ncbi:hypothetical protein H6G20_21850 [Desertifilum sp. FACHB-1129]|uniref:Trypsin-co-occurring domain-containing protein n=1 Tax=Desertifilum tharense IPPAS B-1220 TaxID=1781255 RepID=A0A1E5QHV7_9CYAN|nr:CU044_2847 family protein [Desertifilum tharense]MBD2314317.1 hypothetical protein [Desertifilum sp. FACHB-1129]MBD2324594.1 hypothetical protein [Desertifilum sp. FACHB-866]MBD2334685.1 hypothetical protein [Desertifilum sp. FACHB-868]MCD8490172.1 hypothetical protein [Desertifilum sp.]MDA0209438.1 CU044_2847 family protein [Cyanobacteria bacterium FC1]
MSTTKLVPLQLDENTVLYIEAQSDTESLLTELMNPEEPEQRRNGQKGWPGSKPTQTISPAASLKMLQSTIRAYAAYSLNAFKNFGAANVNEVTLEFGVSLSADGGIPYIASGKTQSNLKITVKCSYDNKTDS